MKPTTWTTRDGRIIPLREMTDDHLLNALAMLFNRYRQQLWSLASVRALQAYSYASTAPDGAAMAAEEYARDVMTDAGLEEILYEKHSHYAALRDEATRRKIPPNR